MPVALIEREKAKTTRGTFHIMSTEMDEAVAFCPRCMTLETLFFTQEGLLQTRKFYQKGNRVYHSCKSSEPCRLYRTF